MDSSPPSEPPTEKTAVAPIPLATLSAQATHVEAGAEAGAEAEVEAEAGVVALATETGVKEDLEGEEGGGGGHTAAFVQKTRDFGFLPIPPHLRYDPARPFHFGLGLNIAFGFASTFIVSNLYYNQPLLIQLSHSFNTSYSSVSSIPSLVQAGYATGLLLISPLGDLLPRRPLVLLTVTLSTSLTIPLALTSNLRLFQVLCYLVGISTVTPQILIPLAADLAPPERRAGAISIVLSGLLFGILIARVFSGIIAEFASWRVVYYFAIGVQSLVLVGAYLLLPDYPSKNTGTGAERLTYGKILGSMARYAVTEPVLVQCTLVNLASAAAFGNFWVTLTFLLGGEPYNYSTLVIGLFGLVGMAGVSFGPLVGYIIDKLVPWYASLVAVAGSIIFQVIQTAAGDRSVAAVVLAAFGLDVFRQMLQVSLTTAAFSISTPARARLNAVLILGIFLGQVTGTSVGTHIFVTYGFHANAAFCLALMGLQVIILLGRGPGVGRGGWVGWDGRRGVGKWEWRRGRQHEHGREFGGGDDDGKEGGEGLGIVMEGEAGALPLIGRRSESGMSMTKGSAGGSKASSTRALLGEGSGREGQGPKLGLGLSLGLERVVGRG
ncbi:major facilitator superfamily domain-containing protein [Ephemerocybe angulata]|uniref:Major facilitator superfamily domain-containing protein n=1 Tax=Ephemerocybe angulata TaxID=980116 RepID=A0A8H6I571_9AGAR|nr:major facilitator superfamily domain-containing protein [Tulosesus angulatus]